MKIFNWVHRKFNHNDLKDEFGIRNWNKKEVESQTNIELELEVVVDGSILSIGTFGFDHPCSIYQQHNDEDHYPITTSYKKISEIQEAAADAADDIQEQEDDDDESESEVKPLMFTKFKEYDFDMTSPNNTTSTTIIMTVDGISLMPEITTSVDHHHKKKGEMRRTTLADLFSADSHDAQFNDNKAHFNTKKRAPSDHAKNNVSFAKKLIPQLGDKSPLVNKLNQMMKRVMKRKIHPELHHVQATPPENMDSLEVQPIDESTYLLPIPGVNV